MKFVGRMFACALLSLSAMPAGAGGPSFWMARAEGEVVIGPDGRVNSVALTSGIDGAVRASVEQRVASWRFEPIVELGRPVIAKARVSLQLRAVELEDGGMQVSIADAFFPRSAAEQQQAASMILHRERISYPKSALRERVGGEVILAVELDAQGVPVRIAPRSGWLFGPDRAAKRSAHWMQVLAEEAARSVRKWRFAEREVIGSEVVLVPVTFHAGKSDWHQAHWVELPEPESTHASNQVPPARLSADGDAEAESIRLLSPLDTPAQSS